MNKILFVLIGLLLTAYPASAQTRSVLAIASVIANDTTLQSSVFQLSMMEQPNELFIGSHFPIFLRSKIKKDTVTVTIEYLAY